MLLGKFSHIIDRSGVGVAVEKKRELIEKTDPNRIYVENIRSFFGLSTKLAKWFLDFGVRQGLLEKRVGIICPNSDCNRMISDFPVGGEPSEITCDLCEMKGEEKTTFNSQRCTQMDFYRVRSAK